MFNRQVIRSTLSSQRAKRDRQRWKLRSEILRMLYGRSKTKPKQSHQVCRRQRESQERTLLINPFLVRSTWRRITWPRSRQRWPRRWRLVRAALEKLRKKNCQFLTTVGRVWNLWFPSRLMQSRTITKTTAISRPSAAVTISRRRARWAPMWSAKPWWRRVSKNLSAKVEEPKSLKKRCSAPTQRLALKRVT